MLNPLVLCLLHWVRFILVLAQLPHALFSGCLNSSQAWYVNMNTMHHVTLDPQNLLSRIPIWVAEIQFCWARFVLFINLFHIFPSSLQSNTSHSQKFTSGSRHKIWSVSVHLPNIIMYSFSFIFFIALSNLKDRGAFCRTHMGRMDTINSQILLGCTKHLDWWW